MNKFKRITAFLTSTTRKCRLVNVFHLHQKGHQTYIHKMTLEE